MATLAEVQASQAAVKSHLDTLVALAQSTQQSVKDQAAQIAALQAQLAAGSPVTAADLDGLKAASDAQLAEIDAALAPAAPAP